MRFFLGIIDINLFYIILELINEVSWRRRILQVIGVIQSQLDVVKYVETKLLDTET